MRTEVVRRFIVAASEAKAVMESVSRRGGEVLMDGGLLVRAVFSDADTRRQGRRAWRELRRTRGWVRVRAGDVDICGRSAVTLTYKRVERADTGRVERVVDVRVDGFDECVELLQEVGLRLRSRQESRRTKVVCLHLGCRYVLTLDAWPWLDDVVFVGVNPIDGIDVAGLEDFCAAVGLVEEKREEYVGGVDTCYAKRLGFQLKDVRDVRFGIPCPPAAVERQGA